MKVYIVIELHGYDPPKILGVYKDKASAEKEAYKDDKYWRNIVEFKVQD